MKLYALTIVLLMAALPAFAQYIPKTTGIEAPATLQLQAYNNRDIDTFIKAYSDDVKVYRQPGVLSYQGTDEMRKRYGQKFAETPDLHCELVNRIVSGNVVIDHERVQTDKNKPRTEAIAIYRIRDSRIYEVTFIYPDPQN
ncbi:nuclear transport factor 2 family protein [Pontibacter sp. BT310]|uniref:Nuclear transport factor 2 family protein n=1 Tax=Pontibacter populi TaxID=890055 RepID=A0ABS6XCW0_9BACT|nr:MULTISPECIES: nuclear transport factor 2 family protein [Pontibacter]MBJ6118979.1 nuclear transport factor 2 family protein [Pontibacter sp. BT310]MBR0571407.1 nuclear transport factor 2 family protein [Microvirga sp. STS03]MBW3365833.1 nuclear transport factor 2 family protein [Pontibacter populi]